LQDALERAPEIVQSGRLTLTPLLESKAEGFATWLQVNPSICVRAAAVGDVFPTFP
jgi:hypothetical protein